MEAIEALVVEDDPRLGDAVAFALRREGMAVDVCLTLRAALAAAPRKRLAVVDLGLPDGSGYDLVTELARAADRPAIVVLTGRTEDVDCISCLEAGADDFVGKPFSPRVLVARARAVLRRAAPPHDVEGERGVDPGLLRVDLARREASYAGSRLDLTRTELDVLAA